MTLKKKKGNESPISPVSAVFLQVHGKEGKRDRKEQYMAELVCPD